MHLQDALSALGGGAEAVSSVLAAGEKLSSFAKQVKNFLNSSKLPPTEGDAHQHQSPVMKSAERMVKISAEQGAAFGLKYSRDDKGESIEINLQPGQASVIRENIKLQREMRKDSTALRRITSTRAAQIAPPTDEAQAETEMFPVPPLGIDQSDEAVLAWIKVIKDIGYARLLPSIAKDFEAQGNLDVASIIRKHISADDGTLRLT